MGRRGRSGLVKREEEKKAGEEELRRRRSTGIRKRLSTLPYAQLQSLAKKAKLKANQKASNLITALETRLTAADMDVTRAGDWGMDASDIDFSRLSFEAEGEEKEEKEETPNKSSTTKVVNLTFSPDEEEKSALAQNRRRSAAAAEGASVTPPTISSPTTPKRRSPRFHQFQLPVSEDEDDDDEGEAEAKKEKKKKDEKEKETDSAIKRRIMAEIDERIARSAAKKRQANNDASPQILPGAGVSPFKAKSPNDRFLAAHAAQAERLEGIREFKARKEARHEQLTSAASERTRRLATPKTKSVTKKKSAWLSMAQKEARPATKALRGGRTFAQVAQGIKKTPMVAKPSTPKFAYASPPKTFHFASSKTPQAKSPRLRFATPSSKNQTPVQSKTPISEARIPRSILKKPKETPVPKSAAKVSPFHFSPEKEEKTSPAKLSFAQFRAETPLGKRVSRTPLGLVSKSPLSSDNLPRPVLFSPPTTPKPGLGVEPSNPSPSGPETPDWDCPAKSSAKAKESGSVSKSPKRLTRPATRGLERLLQHTATSAAKAKIPPKTGRGCCENKAPVLGPVPEPPVAARRHKGPLPPFLDTATLPDDVSRHVARMARARQALKDDHRRGGKQQQQRSAVANSLAARRHNARETTLAKRRGL